MNGSGIIKEIGRSYIVSSFIPASLFVIIFRLIFQDFFPQEFTRRLVGNSSGIDGSTAFLVLFTIWLAFALYSSQDRITKFFEGYHIPKPLKTILTVVQVLKLWPKEKYLRKYLQLKDESGSPNEFTPPEDLEAELMSELQDRELMAPLDKGNLLPTRLGNVLRASEEYAYRRYGIDGITVWPRLYKFIPNELKEDLQEFNNHLAFLLNSSLLAFILTLISLAVFLLGDYCQNNAGVLDSICTSEIWTQGLSYFRVSFYLWSTAVFGLCAYFLYGLSVAAGESYGLYVRSAYDLHRHLLLEHINRTWSKNLKDNKEAWDKLGDFYIVGDYLGQIEFDEPRTRPRLNVKPEIVVVWSLIAGLAIKIIARRYNSDRATI